MESYRKRTSKRGQAPTLPRGFTPTKAQLERALQIVRAGIESGMIPAAEEPPIEQRAPIHSIGQGALTTGHGLAGGGRKSEGTTAYAAFVENVRSLVGERVWGELTVIWTQVAWVQIRGRRGRIYVAKTTEVVSRVESTLEPREVPDHPPPPEGAANAWTPDRPNGSIRSWLRADAGVVAEAVRVIAGFAST